MALVTTPTEPTDTPATQQPGRPPSPPWYGGVTIGMVWVIAAILLSYTLLDWDWQQRLGAWNYVAAAAVIPVLALLLRRWRPDTDRHLDLP